MTVRKISGKWFDTSTRKLVGNSVQEVLRAARGKRVTFLQGQHEDTLA